MRRALAAGILIAAGAWAFWPCLAGTWLWDDDQYVTNNPLLSSAAGLREIWRGGTGVNYFPLTETVWWVERHAWGLAPAGYHLVNLALHLIAAMLVWRLGSLLLRSATSGLAWAAPWAAGLIFAVHPAAVESVAWISELKNTLSLPLALLAMIAFMRDRPWRALAWFVLALLSKTTLAPLPAVLLLHGWWRYGRVTWVDLRRLAPFFATAVLLAIVTVIFERHRAIGSDAPPLEPFVTRVVATPRLAIFYLLKAVWPFGLVPIYLRWSILSAPPRVAQPGDVLKHIVPARTAPAWVGSHGTLVVFALAWVALAAVLVSARRSRVGRRPAAGERATAFALGSWVLLLTPALGWFPMAYFRLAWAADHFAYAALVPLVLAVALGGAVLFRQTRRAGAAALSLTVLALGLATHRYARAFTSPEALWTTTLARNPGAWSAHNDLGSIRFDQARLPEAIAQFREAIRLHPQYPEAFNNLAVALDESGDRAGALAACRQALALRPRYAEAHCNLGNVYLETGRAAEAAAEYQEALALKPDFAEARYNLRLAQRP